MRFAGWKTGAAHIVADTASTIAAVRREFDAIDRGFPVFNIRTLELRIEDALSRARMVAALSAAFGAGAGVGRDRAVRGHFACGIAADPGNRLALVGVGSIAGIAAAAVLSQVLAQYLSGAASLGASSLPMASAAMLFITFLAAGVPAARACRIDPSFTLRNQ